MTKQMSYPALSILTDLAGRTQSGEIKKELAQEEAIRLIENIRYGKNLENYFFILTTRPDMILHPYRRDLIGRYIGELEDPAGHRFYKEMASLAEARGEGFVEYLFQESDTTYSSSIKISYILLFQKWDWIFGTGFYMKDVEQEVLRRSQPFRYTLYLLFAFFLFLLALMIWYTAGLEKQRIAALKDQKNSNQLFKSFINNTFQLIGILDPEGVVFQVNNKALELIGQHQQDVIGQEVWTTSWWSHSPEEAIKIKEAVMMAAEGKSCRFETSHMTLEGETILADLTFNPVWDDKNRIQYIILEGRDITEQKHIEEKLRKLNENLEKEVGERTAELHRNLQNLEGTQEQLIQSEKMAALGRLVAGVAHEINTPLGISVTAASYLDDRTKRIRKLLDENDLTEEDFLSYLENTIESTGMILTNLERAAGQIKVFKQVAVDQSDEAIRNFLLKEYIQEIIKSLHPELKKKPCLIDILCPEELEITTYPGAISQILSNLVMNSMKHGFKNRDSGAISISCRKENNRICIDYQDNGEGISKETAEKIFEPFFTTARGDGGTGLGLHIVYNLVTQKLKGRISINTQQTEGLGFLIDFPVE